MVVYTVAIRPLRIDCAAIQGGHEYVIRYVRKGVSYSTYPQMAVYSGDVVFNSTPTSVWKLFQASFETPNNKRSVEFFVEDATNKKKRVLCVTGVKVDLISCCKVFASECVHKVIEIPARMSGYNATIHAVLLMFPEGSTPPPPPEDQLRKLMSTERGVAPSPNSSFVIHAAGGGIGGATTPTATAGAVGGGSSNPSAAAAAGIPAGKRKLPQAVASALVAAGVLDAAKSNVAIDNDIVEELMSLAAQLGAFSHVGTAADDEKNHQLTSEVAALEQQLDAAVAEGRRLEVEMQSAASSSSMAAENGAGKEAAAVKVLQAEQVQLQQQFEELQRELAACGTSHHPATTTVSTAPAAAMMGILSDDEDLSEEASLTPGAATPETPPSPVSTRAGEESEFVKSLQSDLAEAQQRMQELDAQQTQRDVTAEVCELLDVIANLETLISESVVAEQQEASSKTKERRPKPVRSAIKEDIGSGGKERRKKRKKKSVRFADSAAALSNIAANDGHLVAPTADSATHDSEEDPSHAFSKVIDKILEVRGEKARLKFSIAGACALIAGKSTPKLPEMPPPPPAVQQSVSAHQAGFGDIPPPPIAHHQPSPPATAAPAVTTTNSGGFDDLFSAPSQHPTTSSAAASSHQPTEQELHHAEARSLTADLFNAAPTTHREDHQPSVPFDPIHHQGSSGPSTGNLFDAAPTQPLSTSASFASMGPQTSTQPYYEDNVAQTAAANGHASFQGGLVASSSVDLFSAPSTQPPQQQPAPAQQQHQHDLFSSNPPATHLPPSLGGSQSAGGVDLFGSAPPQDVATHQPSSAADFNMMANQQQQQQAIFNNMHQQPQWGGATQQSAHPSAGGGGGGNIDLFTVGH